MDKVVLILIVATVAGGVGAGAGIYVLAGQRAPAGAISLEIQIVDSSGAPRTSFALGETVRWRIAIVNSGPGPAVYEGSSCLAYASAYDSRRDAMDYTACPADQVRRELPAGRTEVHPGSWDQVCRANCSAQQMDRQVPPGDYFLWAWTAGSMDGEYLRTETWFRIA